MSIREEGVYIRVTGRWKRGVVNGKGKGTRTEAWVGRGEFIREGMALHRRQYTGTHMVLWEGRKGDKRQDY